MAFVKKTWKDRISEFPNRRTVNDGYTTKQVTVGRDEGTITEAGDSFDAANLNDLEQRIEDAYGDVQALVGDEVAAQYDQENVIFDPVATPGHGTGFVVSSDYIANLTAGDLKDVNITSPTQGEALVFDNDGNLVNGTVSTVGNLDDLSDVDTTGKASGDSLRYDGNEWVAKPTTIEMTQAEYNAIVDFTPYANTHIVITDAPNLNPTASDIEYSSGVTVKTAIDSKQDKAWSYIGGLYPNGPALDVSNYNELSIIIETGMSGGTLIHNFVGLMFKPMFDLYPTIRVAYYGSANYNVSGDLTYSSGSLTYTQFSLTGWDTNLIRVFGR